MSTSLGISLFLSGLAATHSASAQILVSGLRTESRDEGGLFLLGTGPGIVFNPIQSTLSLENNPASLALDGADPKTVYAGTFGRTVTHKPVTCKILAYEIVGGIVMATRQLNTTSMPEDFISGVTPIGDDVYFVGRRSFGSIPKAGGVPTQHVELDTSIDPRGMASDGRYIYLATNARTIVRIDPNTPTVFDPFAEVKDHPGEEIQNLAIENSGDLLVVTTDVTRGARLIQIDYQTGRVVRQLTLPFLGARAVAQDPETGSIYVVGAVDATTSASTVTIDDWKVTLGPSGRIPNALSALLVMKPRNAYFRGKVCVAPDGRYARIGTTNRLTKQRPGFTLTLDAGANRSAMLFVGFESPSFQPIDLQVLGAPGCFLGVPAFGSWPLQTDGFGRAQVMYPSPARNLAIHGVILNAQWFVTAPGANLRGLLTSAVARIIVRD